jgi:hypothetical protein
MLEGLRNAYAAVGFERIGTLLEAMNEYRHAVTSFFSSCSNPEKALLDAVDNFIDYLVQAEKNAVDLAQNLIKIDEQERKERPDLGTRGHDAVPLPAAAVGTDAWTDHTAWKPSPARPAL